MRRVPKIGNDGRTIESVLCGNKEHKIVILGSLNVLIEVSVLLLHTASEESTAAPSEKTTAVPPGKSSNNMKQGKT